MRVLHLISSAGWYGAENALVNLAEALQRAGCEVTTGVLRDARNPHTEVADEAQTRGLAAEVFSCRGRLDPAAIASLRRWLAAHPVDVIHTHGYKANFYAHLAGWDRARLVSTIHTGVEQPFSTIFLKFYEALELLFLKRARRVAAVSSPIAETLIRKGIPKARVVTICNGVDPERFRLPRRRIQGVPPGVQVVGTVGRLIREKGPYDLLEAARRAALPNAFVVFVGDGPERIALEAAAQRAGLAERVLFAGVRADMPAVYASLDVFALPSFSEGMPMTVLEAMAAGVPVIATRVGAIPELLAEGECGLLCNPGDPSGLAAALSRLLGDESLSAGLAAAAQRRLCEQYSAQAMARRYLDLYQQVVAEE